jgi:hypothetical protein
MKKQSLFYVFLILLSSFSPTVNAQNAAKNRLLQQADKEYELVKRSFRAIPKVTDYKSLTEQDKQDLKSFGKRVGGLILLLGLLIFGGRILYKKYGTGPALPPPVTGELVPELPPAPTTDLPPLPGQEEQPSPYVDPLLLPQPILQEASPASVLPRQREVTQLPSIVEQISQAKLKKTPAPVPKEPVSSSPLTLFSQMLERIPVKETEPISTEMTASWLEGSYQPTREEEVQYQEQAKQTQVMQPTKPSVMGPLVLTPEQQAEAEKTQQMLQEQLGKRRKTLEESDPNY